MDKSLKEFFAGSYPKSAMKTNQGKTPIEQTLVHENIFPSYINDTKSTKIWPALILLSIASAFTYSPTAFTYSDHIFGTMGLELFETQTGQPKFAVIIIHALFFLILAWIILRFTGFI